MINQINNQHLFNKQHIEFADEPLFLGSGRNISRLDINIEQHIQKQVNDAIGLMWFKNDFTYLEDAKDYSLMSENQRLLFLKNLKFQTLLDSIASRSVSEVFIPVTTNPQLEQWWYQHAFFENNIHSATYAEIIKAMPLNAKEIFDDIMVNNEIISRAESVINVFEQCVFYNSKMILHKHYDTLYYSKDEHKRHIALSLYALNILEAILFKSSFLTSFAFKENGLMSSTGDAIKKINLDEIGHYSMSVNLINRLRVDPEWIHIFEDIKHEARQLYADAIIADHKWIDYCYPEGNDAHLLGINNNVVKEYVDYNAKVVMTAIGLEPLKSDVMNPCSWANKYSKSSNVQTAMKEKNSANYLLGKLNTHTPPEFWENLP